MEIPQATQEQVQRYLWDLYITQYQAKFTYYTFDVVEAWKTGIRAWWEGRRSPLVDILGPVKDALRWFWDNVLKPPLEAMFAGLGWIADKAISGISALLGPIRSFLGSIWETLSGLGSWLWNQVSSGLEGIWSRVSGAFSALKGALDAVYNGIVAMMSRVAEYIISGFKGLFEIFKDIGSWIWEGIKRIIVEPIKTGLEALLDAIKKFGESIWNMIREAIEPKSPARIEGTWKRVLGAITGVTSAIVITEIGIHIQNALHPMKNLEFRQTRDLWLRIAGFHALLSSFHQVYFRLSVEQPLTYELNKLWTPKIPGENQILEMLSRYRISRERAHELMRYHGYGPEWDEWWDELANTPLSFTHLRWAAVGGTLDEAWVEEELKRRGYSERAVKELKRAVRFLAESQDIKDCVTTIRNMVKEGFWTTDQARAAYDAFRTLDNPIERHLFVAHLSYQFDLKVDQRDLVLTEFERGAIGWDVARERLESIGLDPERAEVLLRRVMARMRPKARIDAETDDIREFVKNARNLLKEGFWSPEQAKATFEAYKRIEDPMERQLFLANMSYLFDFKVDQRDTILTKLKKGKISADQAKRELEPIVVVPERRDWLIEKTLAAMRLAA